MGVTLGYSWLKSLHNPAWPQKIWLYTHQFQQWSATHLVQPPRLWASLSAAPGWVLAQGCGCTSWVGHRPWLKWYDCKTLRHKRKLASFSFLKLRFAGFSESPSLVPLMPHMPYLWTQFISMSIHYPAATALERWLWNVLGYHSNDMLMRQTR